MAESEELSEHGNYAPLRQESHDVLDDEVDEPDLKKKPAKSRRGFQRLYAACICLSVCYLLWALLVLTTATAGCIYGSRKPSWVANLVAEDGRSWAPPNISELYRQVMPSCRSYELLEAFGDHGETHPWTLVSFTSREGPDGQSSVALSAWWLPADRVDAPRVVVVHPGDENFNSPRVHIVGYYLRSVGISALLLNLRDHGTSGSSNHEGAGWGYDYPFDILGAWDYAVHDPDGALGGSAAPDKVGLMAFSAGAYSAAVAFGLEPQVPALWVDSMIFSIPQALRHHVRQGPLGWLADPLLPLAWFWTQSAAGVDLAMYTPFDTISAKASQAAAKRPVAIVHSSLDTTVLKEQSQQFESLLADYDSSFEVSDVSVAPCECAGESHAQLYLCQSTQYRDRVGGFWSHALGFALEESTLPSLPAYATCAQDTCSQVRVPATALAALPQDACEDLVDWQLGSKNVSSRIDVATGQPVAVFQRVATFSEHKLDLHLTISGTYELAKLGAPANGVLGSFGSLNMACGSRANLTFGFVQSGTDIPVALPRFFFTVFDIDSDHINSEWLSLPGVPRFAVSGDSVLEFTSPGAEAGTEQVSFKAARGIASRPNSPMEMAADAASHAISILYERVSEFRLEFWVSGCSSIPEDRDLGGHILFAGISSLACADSAGSSAA